MSLVRDIEHLAALLGPILRGEVAEAALDSESTEVVDGVFSPWQGGSRPAGISISYDHEGREVDFYAAIRHEPYSASRAPRRRELIAKGKGTESLSGKQWAELLDEEEAQPIPNLDRRAVYELLVAAFGVKGCRWYLHNAKADFSWLWADDVPFEALPFDRFDDTQFMSVFTDERALDAWDDTKKRTTHEGEEATGGFIHEGHGLKHLGEHYLGRSPDEQKLLKEAIRYLKCESFAHLPLRRIIAPYGCQDTRLTLGLGRLLKAREAFADERVRRRYEREIELLPRVMEMERRGVRRRLDLALQKANEYAECVAELRVKLDETAGALVDAPTYDLPANSPVRLAEVLYDELGFPMYRGYRDTRAATIKHLRTRLQEKGDERRAELLTSLIEYRKAKKELDGFYRPLAQGEGERVHTDFGQVSARTRRFTSRKPNMQNQSDKGEVRHLFIPSEGHVFLMLDYSQIEMRLAAHYTNVMPEVFQRLFYWRCTMGRRGSCKGRGKHGKPGDKASCANIWHTGRPQYMHKPVSNLYQGFMTDPNFDPHKRQLEVCIEQGLHLDDNPDKARGKAKTSNFALLYGVGVLKLSDTLDCSEETARKLFGFFWDEAYPELGYVKDFIGERLRQVGRPLDWSGMAYITTLLGARFYLESAHKALNYLVQGSAREVMGEAMLDVADYCERETHGDYKPVLTVHDELVFEVPRDSIDQGPVRAIAKLMERAGEASSVPLVVDAEWAEECWGNKQPFDIGVTA